ncbi:high affinity cGMP-specific 3',5'-cyclic phosphodiesterase 9A isoform X4 [Mucor ambiguus]|uniref:High affinity cGMP-specific 3',5'-cyclic phosphodiesterase 9A isoform X4 n=1 Tax=Mucor ambiguus TaxID=91626 RepID=A0A0C9M179_9FUNG|nr:high affinity cGMP-specific 3',5'-cyclic phosphodiesterase 9A isoform X4 [Mucor ambiguus]
MTEHDDVNTNAIEVNVLDSAMTDLYGYLLGIFSKLDIFDTLKISTCQFLDFLIDIQRTYQNTPYHSFYHATDVVVVLYYIVWDLKAKKYFSDKEIATLFIAAICHDAGHTGYNNDYHVKLKTELAIRYNNISVLESLSVEITLGLLEKHQMINSIDPDLIRSLILATDMSFHYDLLSEAGVLEDIVSTVNLWDDDEQDSFSDMGSSLAVSETLSISIQQQHLSSLSYNNNNNSVKEGFIQYNDDSTKSSQSPLDPSQRLSFASILLHAADISNTVRTWPISKQWSDLIVQEFFRQGDAEKLAGLQVSPGMDRDLATQASISLKFGDFVVKPYFEALTGLLPRAQIFLDTLQDNREEWLKLKASPFSTSITSYFNGYLASRFSIATPTPSTTTSTTAPSSSKIRKVSVPAGTVAIPLTHAAAVAASAGNATVKPMPILRTSSHSSVLISSPHTSVSSELRRNSADLRKERSRASTTKQHHIQI